MFLPLAYVIRSSWFRRRLTIYAGFCAIALIAAIWFVERFFDMHLITS